MDFPFIKSVCRLNHQLAAAIGYFTPSQRQYRYFIELFGGCPRSV
jgi:hypothetical protein